MKKRFLISIAALAAFASSAGAQGLGIYGGFNFFNQTVLIDDNRESGFSYRTHFHGGLDYELRLAPNLYFAPGMLYSSKGTQDERAEAGAIKYRVNYLELPFNVVFKPDLGSRSKLILSAGPYVAYAMNGKVKDGWKNTLDIPGFENVIPDVDYIEVFTSKRNMKFGSHNEDDLRRVDRGLNFGLGVMNPRGFFVKGTAQIGFRDIGPKRDDHDFTVRNKGISLSLGYRF